MRFIFLAICILLTASCEDFVKVNPPKNQIPSELIFSSDETVLSALSGVYSKMMASSGFVSGGLSSVHILAGFSSDELIYHGTLQERQEFFRNGLLATNATVKSAIWEEAYQYIYYSNSIIEGLESSDMISIEIARMAEGEAKFIRAFCNFYLLNMFGDLPIVLTTDYRVNMNLKRSGVEAVFDQIVRDLTDAAALLPDGYEHLANERIRPVKWAAYALLARAYLYKGDWANAELNSSLVISQSGKFVLEDSLQDVFIKESREAIWQLKPVVPGSNTNDATSFILLGPPSEASLRDDLVNAFEDDDSRYRQWVGNYVDETGEFYFPFKYKAKNGDPVTEYSVVLRLAEQYLIRAEARAHMDMFDGSVADLDLIRKRANLKSILEFLPVVNSENLIAAVLSERRVELFCEFGHRWFDLKRTNLADQVLGAIKPGFWENQDELYPVPRTEIERNINLLPQNEGY